MEPLLLFSLFITHLAVGGELLQYSTDVVYVSDDGIDDSSCLNGGSHCKTLGYVLTNIPMLQCSNCTINVTYDHIVGLFNVSTPNTVDISNVEVLYIVGLGQPRLYFNGSGLKLVNKVNTSIILENLEFDDCNLNQAGPCMATSGEFLYLKSFAITDVVMYNSSSMTVAAKVVHCHGLHCYKSSLYGCLTIVTPGITDSEIVVTNSTFEYSNGLYALAIRVNGSPLNCNSVLIKNCQFFNISTIAITFEMTIDNRYLYSFINFTVQDCWMNSSEKASFVVMEFGTAPLASGSGSVNITIVNNLISNNSCDPCISMKCTDDTASSQDLAIRILNNNFTGNAGTTIDLKNLSYIEIASSYFINNIADDYIISVQLTLPPYGYAKVKIFMHNLIFTGNSITNLPIADKGAIVYVALAVQNSEYIALSHINFTNNKGTPLSIDVDHLNITGDIVFIENNAVTGGGMYISGGTLSISDNTTVSFTENIASYGGAIYVDQQNCFVNEHFRNDSLVFNRNHATNGPYIFSSYDWCSFNTGGCEIIQKTINIVSLPTNMSFNDDNKTSLFPGQTIVGNMTVTDCFSNASSCLADVSLWCDGQICLNYDLQGPTTITFYNGLNINTGLKITAVSQNKGNAQLQLTCKSYIEKLPVHLNIDIAIEECPLGFVFNNTKGQCDCAGTDNYSICDKDVGYACVSEGYWYSFLNNKLTVSKCVHLFCDYSTRRQKCPSSSSPNYLKLGSTQDDQCLDGHGGTLCTGCAHNKLPTYGALQCIDSDKCAKWHPYVLLLFNTAIPFIYGVFLMIAVRLKLSIGSGYLYGPLFYLAVLNLIPFTSYNMLNKIVSFYVSTFLLKLEILGYMPWCLFRSVSLLTSKWFELIAPSVVAVVLLLTVYLARRSPKLVGRIQQSPLQAMCLLMFVLFWSLASTAISVITPVYLSGVEGARVHLQPDLPYLSGGHIPLWIVSVMILLVLYSIVFVLTFSRFLNLHRFKPVLDEFQSCYKDSCWWYGGVYFIIWTILQVLNLASSYQLFQTFIIVVTVTHCLLQPYCKKWLNIVDGLFLGCLNATSCLILKDMSPYFSTNITTKILVYMSMMVPLGLISLGIVYIILVSLGLVQKINELVSKLLAIIESTKRRTVAVPVPQPRLNIVTRSTLTVNTGDNANDREPLLRYLQDTAN